MTETPSQASPFNEITRRYYQAWFRYHPEAAVDAGVPGYASLLTPFAPDALGAVVCLNDELRVSLDELERKTLSPDQDIDYQILYGAALLENQRLLEIEAHRPDPERMLPINAVYQLLIRNVENFDDALMARLTAIPDHLRGAGAYLSNNAEGIPPLWLGTAVTTAREGIIFFRGLSKHPKIHELKKPITGFESALDGACRALSDYADYMEQTLLPRVKGSFACGADYFARLLQQRHFLDTNIDELSDFGEELFDQTQDELKAVCKKLFGHADTAAATRAIQVDHPTSEDLLSVYRKQMQAARQFVIEHDLVTLPAKERLDVVETPLFLRHQIPFAAYHEPSPNDPEQQGYYYVTPPTSAEQLAEHDHAGLIHTCVHEAWPGHHLQFVTANLNPAARTLPRFLNPTATLYEGWALYCEQLMLEQGFLNRPEQRFILLKDRLWRALRILIDVGLHTQGLTLDKAADRMQQTLGFPRSQALADLTWYSRSPSVPLGYATGWRLIRGLRAHEELKKGFLLKQFHDRLLSAGSIALPLVIRRVYGSDVWENLSNAVFGEVFHETA